MDLEQRIDRLEAIEAIKQSIRKTYGKKGEEVVAMNIRAVESTLEHLHEALFGMLDDAGLLPEGTLE